MGYEQMIARLRKCATVTAAVLAVAACQDTESVSIVEPGDLTSGDAVVSLDVSAFGADLGSLVTVAVNADEAYGMEGYLRFNPSSLRFAGQVAEDGTAVVLNDEQAAAGLLRFVSVNADGFGDGHAALFSFEVRGSGYEAGLSIEPTIVSSRAREALRVRTIADLGLDLDLPTEGTLMSIERWALHLDPTWTQEGDSPLLAPNESDTYGDVSNDGGISVFDVLGAAQLNAGLVECIIGQTEGGLDCTAANVDPVNDGPGGLCAPCLDTCGAEGRSINIFDVLAIAQDNANNPDHPVVGEAIPRPAAVGVGDTVSINGFFAGAPGGGPAVTLTDTILLTAGTLWQLERQIRVGDEAGAEGVLIIEPGVTIEGRDSTSILVTRNGKIFSDGTPDNPILMTCVDDASTPGSAPGFRAPACWGGVYVAGNATVNEGDGSPLSPAIAGRTGAGALTRAAEGFDPSDVFFGGDNDADSSGSITYTIFAWGGFEVTLNNELNNLTLGACGSGTVLHHIQVHGGSDDGLELFGGRCDVDYLYATENDDDSDDYSFGYDGNQQYLILQSALSTRFLGDSDKAFEVDNTEDPLTYGTFGPGDAPGRTYANIWNLTIAMGDNASTPNDRAFNYRRGAGSTLGNVIVAGANEVFDVDNLSQDACPGGSEQFPMQQPEYEMRWTTTLVLRTGTPAYLTDSGGCDAAITDSIAAGSVIASTGDGSGTIYVQDYAAGDLRDPFDRDFPDFRQRIGGLGFAAQTPPAGFDAAAYLGALDPNGGIPWYVGWTKGSSQLR